jgi:hypothetical protein
MKTDTKLENCHNRRNGISPVSCTDIKVTGIRPVEISSENCKKGTFSKTSKLNSFKISEN